MDVMQEIRGIGMVDKDWSTICKVIDLACTLGAHNPERNAEILKKATELYRKLREIAQKQAYIKANELVIYVMQLASVVENIDKNKLNNEQFDLKKVGINIINPKKYLKRFEKYTAYLMASAGITYNRENIIKLNKGIKLFNSDPDNTLDKIAQEFKGNILANLYGVYYSDDKIEPSREHIDKVVMHNGRLVSIKDIDKEGNYKCTVLVPNKNYGIDLNQEIEYGFIKSNIYPTDIIEQNLWLRPGSNKIYNKCEFPIKEAFQKGLIMK